VRVKFPELSVREALKLAARISEWEHWSVHKGYKGIPLRARPLQVILVHQVSPSQGMDIIDITEHGEGLRQLFTGLASENGLLEEVKARCDQQGWKPRRWGKRKRNKSPLEELTAQAARVAKKARAGPRVAPEAEAARMAREEEAARMARVVSAWAAYKELRARVAREEEAAREVVPR